MPVYFIQDDGGEIKIGFSQGNPYGRLNAFKTGNPRELKLLVSIPGGREEEQALHERFADLRTRGEWFRPDPRLLGFIEGMKYAYKDAQPEPVKSESILLGLTYDQLRQLRGALNRLETLDDAACEMLALAGKADRQKIASLQHKLAGALDEWPEKIGQDFVDANWSADEWSPYSTADELDEAILETFVAPVADSAEPH